MKKLLFSIFLIQSILNFAQEKIVVQYEMRNEFDAEAMVENLDLGNANIPKSEIIKALTESMSKSSDYSLVLTANESEFKYIERISNEQPTQERSRIVFQMGNDDVIYKNLNEKVKVRVTSAFNQNYLVTDSLKNYDWKISRESKEILGYEVRKAETVKDSAIFVTAWYAPKLQYKNGPEEFQGLPGLILELKVANHSNDEKQTDIYQAISLTVDSNQKSIERPKKGKVISSVEFDKFLEEQSAKMQEMFNDGVDKD